MNCEIIIDERKISHNRKQLRNLTDKKMKRTLNSVSAGLVVGNSLTTDSVDTKGLLQYSKELK